MLQLESIFRERKRFRAFFVITLLYTALSFSFSFAGFLHLEPNSHFHEYAPDKLVIEIIGHVLFGFVAALPLLDLQMTMLTGALAVLIDIDHLLSALNFEVNGRPDHSILYLLISTAFLIFLSYRLKLDNPTRVKLAFVAPIVLFAHLSYDVLASSGSSFPLGVPLDFANIMFPYYFWAIFEAIALVLAVLGLVVSKRSAKKAAAAAEQDMQLRRAAKK